MGINELTVPGAGVPEGVAVTATVVPFYIG